MFWGSTKEDKDISLNLEEDDSKDFFEYLKEAQETDLTDIERTGCVSQGRDMRNNHVIIMIPSLGLNKVDRPETIFRKMLLLFLVKTHEMVGSAYSVVYAHTAIDLMNQYPLIYKFYSILPRSYKKNLLKMYIIHPNIGIRAFFEFARIFLSHKFYNKLCLVESILDFQRIINPTQLHLPLKFLRREDEERELKYHGRIPGVRQSFNNHLGTMEVLWCCAEFLVSTNGVASPGIFRVPGDDGEMSLVKVRLQHGYPPHDPQNGWVALSENRKYILVGDLNMLYSSGNSGGGSPMPVSGERGAVSAAAVTHLHRGSGQSSGTQSGQSSAHSSLRRKDFSLHSVRSSVERVPPPPSSPSGKVSTPVPPSPSSSSSTSVPDETLTSIVVLQSPFTVAELFKFCIRELPEALVPESITQEILEVTNAYGSRPLDIAWEISVASLLSSLPLSHLSSLLYILRFLRLVATHSSVNNMDTKNLSVVFAPTIFRFEMVDLIAATRDIRTIQRVMIELLDRPSLLHRTVRDFLSLLHRGREEGGGGSRRQGGGGGEEDEGVDWKEIERLVEENPLIREFNQEVVDPPLEIITQTAVGGKTGGEGDGHSPLALSPAMVARMKQSGDAALRRRGATVTEREEEEEVEVEEERSSSRPVANRFAVRSMPPLPPQTETQRETDRETEREADREAPVDEGVVQKFRDLHVDTEGEER